MCAFGGSERFGNQINSLCYRAKIFALHIRHVGFVFGTEPHAYTYVYFWVSGPSDVLKPRFRVRQDVVYIPGASRCVGCTESYHLGPLEIY